MSKEHSTTRYDAAMRTAMISIAEQLYQGSMDARDAGLVELERNGARLVVPYVDGPRLLVEDMDSASTFALVSSLSAPQASSRTMAFSVTVSEVERIGVPTELLSPEARRRLRDEALIAATLEDIQVRKVWSFRALANQEGLIRNPYTVVTVRGRSALLYPDTPPDEQVWDVLPAELISAEGLAQLPIPSAEELDVPRFDRIVQGLGFSALEA